MFKRLDTGGYTSDIDDIALLYIEKIKSNHGVALSIKNNKSLVDLLINSMSKGWTTDKEEECINFLNNEK